MVPRKPLANWQNSAHPWGVAGLAVALRAVSVKDGAMEGAKRPFCLDCYPSFRLWPVRPSDGPFFNPRARAVFRQSASLCFSTKAKQLNTAGVMTLERGCFPKSDQPVWWVGSRAGRAQLSQAAGGLWSRTSTNLKRDRRKCINPSSLQPCWLGHPCCPHVARSPSAPIAPQWAQLAARCLARPPITTSRKARWLAGPLVALQAPTACATDPAIGRQPSGIASNRPSGVLPRVVFSFSGPAEGRRHPGEM